MPTYVYMCDENHRTEHFCKMISQKPHLLDCSVCGKAARSIIVRDEKDGSGFRIKGLCYQNMFKSIYHKGMFKKGSRSKDYQKNTLKPDT